MNGTSVNNYMHHKLAGNLSRYSLRKTIFEKMFSFLQYRILNKATGLLLLASDFQNSK